MLSCWFFVKKPSRRMQLMKYGAEWAWEPASPLRRRPVMDIFLAVFHAFGAPAGHQTAAVGSVAQTLIALIERQRKSRVVLLVHRQETMSLLGFPVFRYIDINDSEEVLRAIH